MQKIFYFWWIHTSRAWLFRCSKSLQSPLVCIHLVLSSWVKEKVLCFKFYFRMYFFSITTAYQCLYFLPQLQLPWNKLWIISEFEKYQSKSFVYYQGLCESVCWWSFMQRFKRVSYKQTLNLTPFFFATDWYATCKMYRLWLFMWHLYCNCTKGHWLNQGCLVQYRDKR